MVDGQKVLSLLRQNLSVRVQTKGDKMKTVLPSKRKYLKVVTQSISKLFKVKIKLENKHRLIRRVVLEPVCDKLEEEKLNYCSVIELATPSIFQL